VRLEARPPDLAAENPQLMAEHEDLELLGAIATAEEHDELEQATDDDVQGGHKQRQPPADGDADATAGPPALAPHLIEYLHPTRMCSGGDWRRRLRSRCARCRAAVEPCG
jgi:hypothetical protein